MEEASGLACREEFAAAGYSHSRLGKERQRGNPHILARARIHGSGGIPISRRHLSLRGKEHMTWRLSPSYGSEILKRDVDKSWQPRAELVWSGGLAESVCMLKPFCVN